LSLAVVDGFENNTSGLRGLRVGIDASLWYFHAENSTDAGSNPELRLLAFRCFKLLGDGLIPLFMFDGPERPEIKRGNRKGKKGQHWLNRDFTNLLDCFGIEWRKVSRICIPCDSLHYVAFFIYRREAKQKQS
jgi:holliday junction resolvase YEN1